MSKLCRALEPMNKRVVPYGFYNVKVDKMHLKETKEGDPVFSAWFKIIEGDFAESIIPYEKQLTHGFWIHQACELMRSLKSGLDICFQDYEQFTTLMNKVFKNICDSNMEYLLKYQGSDEIEEYEVKNAC